MLIRSTGDEKLDAFVEFEVRYNASRWAEVWLAFQMTMIGVVLLFGGNTFQISPGYNLISSFVTEQIAGVGAFGTGMARLFALWVNGAKRRSPLIRVAGCIFGVIFWFTLGMGFVLAVARGEFAGWPLVLAWFFASMIAEIHSSGRSTRDAFAYYTHKTASPDAFLRTRYT